MTERALRRTGAWLALGCLFIGCNTGLHAQNPQSIPARKIPPLIQVLPQPRLGAEFQIAGKTVLGFDAGANGMRRPFLFPLLGPSGIPLTRMGHPHDPVSHSHHNSVWISHHNVGGDSFWSDTGGMIQTRRITRLEDGETSAFLEADMEWTSAAGASILREKRRIRLTTRSDSRWRIDLESELETTAEPLVAGTEGFGFIGVRMAKTIGVHDGGGRILNSEGAVNEAACFRKPARWVDYSGPVSGDTDEGITLLDHPQNLNHPVEFHVRNDGWMGAATTLRAPYRFEPGMPLRLKYGLLVHGANVTTEILEAEWKIFSESTFLPFGKKGAAK